MPIFEYGCRSCGNDFELLVRSDTRVACPGCGSETVTKKLSLFAAHVGRPAPLMQACGGEACEAGGGCCGQCGLN